jgi:hypothetical protein
MNVAVKAVLPWVFVVAVPALAQPAAPARTENPPVSTAPARVPAQLSFRTVVGEALPAEAANMTVWLEAHNSPKLTTALRPRLAAAGYRLSDTAEGADIKVAVRGAIAVGGIKREEKRAEFSEIIEAGSAPTEADAKAYGGNPSLAPVASDAALWQAGVFSSVMPLMTATSIGNWLGAKTGFAGWFNKMITGDERGWCVHENCNKWQTSSLVVVSVDGKAKANWRVEGSVWNEKVVVQEAIASSLAEALKPFGSGIGKPDAATPATLPQATAGQAAAR